MQPIQFAQQTVVFAKDQPDYLPLPAHVSIHGVVTCCWELTEAEMVELAKTKRLWIQTLTFNQPLQPIRPSVDIPIELG